MRETIDDFKLEWFDQNDTDKRMVYAVGTIRYFTNNDKDRSLYFDGEIISTGEIIHRNIKLSKHVRGYEKGKDKLLPYNEYPEKNVVYSGKLILETWEWHGYSCMRVSAFEIDDVIGVNVSHKLFSRNPFTALQEYMDANGIDSNKMIEDSNREISIA